MLENRITFDGSKMIIKCRLEVSPLILNDVINALMSDKTNEILIKNIKAIKINNLHGVGVLVPCTTIDIEAYTEVKNAR